MSCHKHGHQHEHHHHHQPKPCVEEEEYCSEVYQGEHLYAAPPPTAYAGSECAYERVHSGHYERERERELGRGFQRNERLGELGAVAAGAFALYEGHKAKMDPEHASKHKLEAGTAGMGALGSAGYAYYEHHQKEKFEDGRW